MAIYSKQELAALGFAHVGKNVKLSTQSSIYGAERISIGDNTRIDDFVVLSAGEGGIEIGAFVHIAIMCSLIGKAKITLSDFCGISGRVGIYSSSDDYLGMAMTNPTVPENYIAVESAPVFLGRHAVVGTNSVLLPGAYLEDGVAVGALSLVGKRLKEFTVYQGNPLREVRRRSRNLLQLEAEFLATLRESQH